MVQYTNRNMYLNYTICIFCFGRVHADRHCFHPGALSTRKGHITAVFMTGLLLCLGYWNCILILILKSWSISTYQHLPVLCILLATVGSIDSLDFFFAAFPLSGSCWRSVPALHGLPFGWTAQSPISAPLSESWPRGGPWWWSRGRPGQTGSQE